MSLCARDYVMPVIAGSTSAIMKSMSLLLFIMLLAFKHIHLSLFLLIFCDVFLVDLFVLFLQVALCIPPVHVV